MPGLGRDADPARAVVQVRALDDVPILQDILLARAPEFEIVLQALNLLRETLMQLWTPDDVRGRVNAVNRVFIGASNELGEFRAGAVAARLGAVTAVVAGGFLVGQWLVRRETISAP